jgi:four helix bundle protein
MKIAAKEADEVQYWLMLFEKLDDYPACEHLLKDCTSIILILSKIIGSSKRS